MYGVLLYVCTADTKSNKQKNKKFTGLCCQVILQIYVYTIIYEIKDIFR